jgi:hypothetical protein
MQYVEGRNVSAHETSSDLARLLMDPLLSDLYERYHEHFTLVYGKSPQEKALEHSDPLNELI